MCQEFGKDWTKGVMMTQSGELKSVPAEVQRDVARGVEILKVQKRLEVQSTGLFLGLFVSHIL